MLRSSFIVLCLITISSSSGCSKPPATISMEGGTRGKVTSAGLPVSEVEVKVYLDGSQELLGFGDTNSEGWFLFQKSDGSGALLLDPGAYRFTFNSIGNPSEINSDYRTLQSTPVIKILKAANSEVHLEIEML